MSVYLQFQQKVQHGYTVVNFGYQVKTTKAKLPMIDFTLMLDSSPEVGDYTSLT